MDHFFSFMGSLSEFHFGKRGFVSRWFLQLAGGTPLGPGVEGHKVLRAMIRFAASLTCGIIPPHRVGRRVRFHEWGGFSE